MKLNVQKDKLELVEEERQLAKAIDIYEIEIEFSDEWAELAKTMLFINGQEVYESAIVDGKTIVPSMPSGNYKLGVVGIVVENDKIIKRLPTNLIAVPIQKSSAEHEKTREITEKEADTYEKYLQSITAKSIEIAENVEMIEGLRNEVNETYTNNVEIKEKVESLKNETQRIKDVAQDLVSAVTFTTFEVNVEDGGLYVNNKESLENMNFEVNNETGELEVGIDG